MMIRLTCAACGAELAESDARCRACSAAVQILRQRYQLMRELGRGGFGRVHEAIDRVQMRRCAIKIVEQSILNAAQIQEEVDLLVQHAGSLAFIPTVYEHWVETDQHYIVMQYISGQTLDRITPKPWNAATVEHFLRVMLENLAQLHDAQIVHRDIKPVNIKRTDEGLYILLDFGIAKRGMDAQSIKAMTLDYAPLEQLHRSRRTDQRSDLYSLAATAYHLLTNQLPTLAHERQVKALKLPSELVPGVPAQLERALVHMLAPEPADRPDDARAVLALLDRPVARATLDAITEQATQPAEDAGEAELIRAGNGCLYDIAWAQDYQRIVAGSSIGLFSYHTQTFEKLSERRMSRPVRWVAALPGEPIMLVITDINAQLFRQPESASVKTLCSFPAPAILAAVDPGVLRLAVAAETFIQIWRIAGATAALLCQHQTDHRCRALAFAANGTLLGAAIGAEVIIWDAAGGQIQRRISSARGSVTALAFSAQGEFLATLSGPSVQLWRTSDGQLLQTIETSAGRAIKAQFMPDTQALVCAWERAIQVRRTADGELLHTFDNLAGPVIDTALAPDGAHLAITLARELLLIRTADKAPVGKPIELPAPLACLRFSDDSTMLAGWSEADIYLARVSDGRAQAFMGRHLGRLSNIAYTPDGRTIVAMDGAVRVWECNENALQLRYTFGSATARQNGLAIAPDGATLAAASSAGVQLWSLRDGRAIGQLACQPAQAHAIAFTPDSAHLVIISGECEVWRVADGTRMRGYPYAPDTYDMTISGDGQTFAVLREDLIEIVQTAAGTPVYQLPAAQLDEAGGASPVEGIASSPDGSLLALMTRGRVIIWHTGRGEQLSAIERPAQRAVFTADNQSVALVHDATISIWTIAPPQLRHELSGHTELIGDVAFSPDGRRLASAAYDGTVRLWNSE